VDVAEKCIKLLAVHAHCLFSYLLASSPVRKQQADITETKQRPMVEGYWKIRNCWEGNGLENCRRSCIAVRMSLPTAETITHSSKTQVTIYGNIGKH